MTTQTTQIFVPATEAQMGYLNKLRGERGQDAYDGSPLSKSQASTMIDMVKATPRPARPQTDTDRLTPGVYRKADGTIYRVYPARSGGHMLAKVVLPTGGFEYAGAARRYVSADQRLTVEEAATYGAAFGVCLMCGALLTDPDSVAAGIGPICAAKY